MGKPKFGWNDIPLSKNKDPKKVKLDVILKLFVYRWEILMLLFF